MTAVACSKIESRYKTNVKRKEKRGTKGKSSERNKASDSRSELIHELFYDGTDIVEVSWFMS